MDGERIESNFLVSFTLKEVSNDNEPVRYLQQTQTIFEYDTKVAKASDISD